VKSPFLLRLAFFFGMLNCWNSTAWSSELSMKEVMNAFLWIKVGTEFPAQVNSESENEISFLVFDEAYRIQREPSGFRIENSVEWTSLSLPTVEKILPHVISQNRADASLTEEQFKKSISIEIPKKDFQVSKSLYQCSSDLPMKYKEVRDTLGWLFSHTWLQQGPFESFGMPFTDDGTYFGGRAHLRSPDSFIERKPRDLKCSPVFVPVDSKVDEVTFSQRATCIARKMSLSQDPILGEGTLPQGWIPHLDYHVLSRNCLKATRFVLECAGAKAPFSVNLGIGGAFRWDEKNSVTWVGQGTVQEIHELRDELKAIRQLETMTQLEMVANRVLDHAHQLDSFVRGQSSGSSQTKSLGEMCELIRSSCAD
jgi:hypothetical protein